MTQYSGSTTVAVAAPTLFAYLSNVENLPQYFPRITSARATDGEQVQVTAHIEPEDGPPQDVEGQAWIRVERADTTLTWGANGPNNYTGQLDLDPIDDSSCTLTVTISTENASADHIQDGVDEAVQGVKRAAENAHA